MSVLPSFIDPDIVLSIVLSVPSRLTGSDYPFGIFKLYLSMLSFNFVIVGWGMESH